MCEDEVEPTTLLRRAAIHASLVALYGLGGFLVSRGLMPLRVLLSAIGFTFSLVFATQGCVQTFSDAQRALVSLARSTLPSFRASGFFTDFRVCGVTGQVSDPAFRFWCHWPGQRSLLSGLQAFLLASGFLVSIARSVTLPLGFWCHWPGHISLHLWVEG